MDTVNVRMNPFSFPAMPVAFESNIKDSDGCKFFVAKTSKHKTSIDDENSCCGLLIVFGSDELKNPESSECSDYFSFSENDDKKVIAAQLRELADWFDQQ